MRRIKVILFSAAFAVALAIMTATPAQAVDVINCDDPDLAQSIACSGSDSDENPVIKIILNVAALFLYAVIVATIIMIIVSGLRYIFSGGNQQTVATAKNTIKYALIGMVLALLAAVMINILVDVLFPGPDTSLPTDVFTLMDNKSKATKLA